MGWRTTAQNLNLNRDYAKADAPEMRAMLALLLAWDPVLYVDLHVTDGAKFQHDVVGDWSSRRSSRSCRCSSRRASSRRRRWPCWTRQGTSPLEFYPAFVMDDDPSLGVRDRHCRRRGSPPGTGAAATASGCWWRRTAGTATPSG